VAATATGSAQPAGVADDDVGFDCAQPSASADAQEQRLLELLNEVRAHPVACVTGDAGAPPERRRLAKLTPSSELSCAARRNSHAMARTGVFAHRDVTGAGPHARSEKAGYRGKVVLENLAWGQADAQAVMNSWLASPGHCRALFSGAVREAGAGLSWGASNKPFWTLLLGGPG
jgi:uncharacterized protein YkwD